MGRQHTTWISDETWERLKDIPGDSTSERLRNAVKFADPNEGLRARAIERQRDELLEMVNELWTRYVETNSPAGMMHYFETKAWLWQQ